MPRVWVAHEFFAAVPSLFLLAALYMQLFVEVFSIPNYVSNSRPQFQTEQTELIKVLLAHQIYIGSNERNKKWQETEKHTFLIVLNI